VKLPRWTAYASLALIFMLAIVAFPKKVARPWYGAPAATKFPRVVVLGIDGMDPDILRDVMQRYPGQMPHFEQLASEGGIHPLGTSTPPQSPVAWSNFITGQNPGGHGIYDFIHRNVTSRGPAPSTSTEGHEDQMELWGDWQLPEDVPGEANRSGVAFWTTLMEHGIPADVWRMPANFPVEKSEGYSFSGMMTPAIDSAYGECTFFTTNPPVEFAGDERVVGVSEFGGRIDTRLTGPPNGFRKGRPTTSVPMTVFLDRASGGAAVEVDGHVLILEPGEWSDFTPLMFHMLGDGAADTMLGWFPGMQIGGTVRFYLRSIEPEFEMYASPVNIDPSNPAAPVSEPAEASAEVADIETGIGPYYTQGMPEDVNALKRKVLSDAEFMGQAELVHDESERMMDWALDRYMANEDGGLLFFYYSSVDLCCHMMWRHSDEEHPDHDHELADGDSSHWSGREGSTWHDVVDDLYLQMDSILGRLREQVGHDTRLIVMSDHGFAPYARKFSLNTWLLENGYLVLKGGEERELVETDSAHEDVWIMTAVDWSKTRAYGQGFNGLYLNLNGRELDDPETDENESGIVSAGAEADALLAELKQKLEAFVDPKTGENVVLRADLADTVFSGARRDEAPDMIVGYNYGYGNSDEASQGRIPNAVLIDNDAGGTFNGSHLMAPDVVAGILMTNGVVRDGAHALEDLTVEVLKQYGIQPGAELNGHPVLE
jgi:predicted AlkP superfamily phosphohydrolase/phosphomutase